MDWPDFWDRKVPDPLHPWLVEDGWRRTVGLSVLLVLGSISIGAVIGTLLVAGPGGSRSAAIQRLDAIRPGSLLADAEAGPTELADPLAIGSFHAGVAVVADSSVDAVNTDDGRKRAPVGSTLLAFQLDDWGCAEPPCKDWRSLEPYVELDGNPLDLPDEGDTFVVVLPPGVGDLDLVVEADGFTQRISLLHKQVGSNNIALLESGKPPKQVPIRKTFRLGERTSIPLDAGGGDIRDSFEREVVVEFAQRHFFFQGTTPGSPRRAFLVTNAYYSYVGRAEKYIVPPGLMTFVAADGTRYPGRDLDPSDKGLLGFELPANLTKGTLVIGGTVEHTASTGVTYTSTLAEAEVPIDVG